VTAHESRDPTMWTTTTTMTPDQPIRTVIVLGGGSAGFMAALALKAKLPDLVVTVVRSKELGIIGVGEGSTVPLSKFLHGYLGIAPEALHQLAGPTWKLGLKFLRWGPRPHFFYTFTPEQPHARVEGLPRSIGYYSGADGNNPHHHYDLSCALMDAGRVFERNAATGQPVFPGHFAHAYHFENERPRSRASTSLTAPCAARRPAKPGSRGWSWRRGAR
jgi:tryptophan halogenase